MLDRNLEENVRFIIRRRDAIRNIYIYIYQPEVQEYPGRIDVPQSLLAINILGVAVKG